MSKKRKDPHNGGAWIELEEDRLIKNYLEAAYAKKHPKQYTYIEPPVCYNWLPSEWLGRFKDLFGKMKAAGVQPSDSAKKIYDELTVLDVMDS